MIDLLVKVYSTDYSQRGIGKFTQKLDSLKEGDKVNLTEVAGSVRYQGRGLFDIISPDGEINQKSASKVGLISNGTAITAMYQFLQAAEEDPIDTTAFSLLSFYQTPMDALLEEDLMRMEHQGRISYFPVVESPDENWNHGEGKLDKNLIESFMPEPDDPESMILISGDQEMSQE